MSRIRIGAILTVGILLGPCLSSVSRGEDAIVLRPIRAGELASTRSNSFMSAMPGGRFVVNVAHLAPSPEDLMVRGVPATCDSVRYRIDTLTVKRADGRVEVELGAEQSLAPGEAAQLVHDVDPRTGAGLPTSELDLVGFRLRAEQASSRCGIVASASFHPSDSTAMPVPLSVIPNIGASPRVDSGGGR